MDGRWNSSRCYQWIRWQFEVEHARDTGHIETGDMGLEPFPEWDRGRFDSRTSPSERPA